MSAIWHELKTETDIENKINKLEIQVFTSNTENLNKLTIYIKSCNSDGKLKKVANVTCQPIDIDNEHTTFINTDIIINDVANYVSIFVKFNGLYNNEVEDMGIIEDIVYVK
jgi:hypothetical protein